MPAAAAGPGSAVLTVRQKDSHDIHHITASMDKAVYTLIPPHKEQCKTIIWGLSVLFFSSVMDQKNSSWFITE